MLLLGYLLCWGFSAFLVTCDPCHPDLGQLADSFLSAESMEALWRAPVRFLWIPSITSVNLSVQFLYKNLRK